MTTAVTLRPATTADGEFAFRVWKAAMQPYIEATWGWDDDWQRQHQQEEFGALPYQIIEVSGQPIGTLIVKRTPDHVYLSGLYLLPEHQRQGFGSRILEDLLAEGQAHHLPVRLRVLKVNPQARHLYERLGFVAIDEEEHFIVMEKLPEEAVSQERIAVTLESVTTEEGGGSTYFATLQDDAKRQIRIFIGRCEAQSLALCLQGQPLQRPLTYEAMLSCLTAVGAVVEEVCIHDLRNETFYAVANLRVGDTLHPVEMRPSDALNLAVRADCALYVSESVFLACIAPEPPAAVDQTSETRSVTVTKASEPLTLSIAEVSEELARMFAEDQSDRTTEPIDWEQAGLRDAARLARVKQLYHGQAIQTGENYSHAAMILQHSPGAEDHLLAHEFCVAALSQDGEKAKWFTLWLAAASEDRFLMNIGRPQRFGTQYRVNDGIASLYETDPEMEDSLRRVFNVPPLSEAQAQADEMSKKPE